MAVLSVKEAVELGERYEIAPSQRLPAFDNGMAEAYAATDRIDPAIKVSALIAPGHLANRGLAIAPTRNAAGAYLMWPMASAIVDWPVGVENGEVLWGRRAEPKRLVPKPTTDTRTPVLPICRYSMKSPCC